ncbi:NADPH-dependent FMN reductase [Croceicoccus gelatinilyticus]|uniref:NADPH-dependent FMN reductase n=1 Tax=Croceicoccus gelatinilyticus TaxID=2835536 RepID=UPI001BCEBED3|nr:NAD(P)H-dependent oxidoreductase [Croceicoccus gelatinilyticus]MBS7668710.1 NAD(P)H-dependent oxidoreductase [Croceicoccus gelatinilyticus]
MSRNYNVAVLVGSLRKDSYTRKLAQVIVAQAPANLSFNFVEIGDLPLYNEDLDTDTPPAAWVRYREEMNAADAVLFVTPEYNRSVPGALKNAIDVGSRPYGEGVFKGKPAAVVTGSPGGMAGFGANHHLRQSLVFLDMYAMAQPEAYIGGMWDLFDDNGELANEDTRAFLRTIAESFADWIERTVAPAVE